MGGKGKPIGPGPDDGDGGRVHAQTLARRTLREESPNSSEAEASLRKRVDNAWRRIFSVNRHIDGVRCVPLYPRTPIGEVFMRYPRGHGQGKKHRTESETVIEDHGRAVLSDLAFKTISCKFDSSPRAPRQASIGRGAPRPISRPI